MPLTFPLVGSGEDADKALVATRVLIVDDHPLTREALGSLLQQHGFEIAGQARTASRPSRSHASSLRTSSCST